MPTDKTLTTEALEKTVQLLKEKFGMMLSQKPVTFAQGGTFTVRPEPVGNSNHEAYIHSIFRSSVHEIRAINSVSMSIWASVEPIQSQQNEQEKDQRLLEIKRENRFLELRGSEKGPLRKLGEINQILEAEGFPPTTGTGLAPHKGTE